jgi:hypothetical protein
VKVNADKCEAITFTRSRRQADAHCLTIDGNPVPWKTTVRYLGVLLDKTMTLTPHVDRVCNLASKGLASLGPLFNTGRLSTRFKLRLYAALLRPVITYATRPPGMVSPGLQDLPAEASLRPEQEPPASHRIPLGSSGTP